MTTLGIKKLKGNAIIPEYQTKGAAGFDLHCNESFSIMEGETILVGTGLAMEIPAGYEVQIRPRSGLAHKCNITVLNSPGTIDSDYKGEVKVMLHRQASQLGIFTMIKQFVAKHMPGFPGLKDLSLDTLTFEEGERIAQAVFVPAPQAKIQEIEELTGSERGAGGFGSTGK
jgi:dUTP pyrophosphatase